MSNIIIYNSKGMILRDVQAPPDMLQLQIQEGEFGLENTKADIFLDYILEGQVTRRPTQNTTIDKITLIPDGVDKVTLSNVPNGIFLAFDQTRTNITHGNINGTDTFSTTIPGIYQIQITSFPFLDFTTTITATV